MNQPHRLHADVPLCEADHRVQFYEDDERIVEAVSRFVGEGLRAGEGAIVIATAAHRQSLRAALVDDGVAIDAACASGQALLLDARETLDRFLVDGQPDHGRFGDVIGRTVEGMIARYPHVRAYGEMVDLLCESGERAAMLELERLWTRLLAMRPVGLLCGYRLDRFARGSDAADFHRVCDAHRHVIPSTEWDGAESEMHRRVIAALQQQAVALRGEIAERERVERELRASEAQSKRRAAALSATNEELSRFAYICAHDLKEPLRMVTQFVDLFARRNSAGIDPTSRRWLDYAREGAHRISGLLDGLLRYTTVGEGMRPEAVDLDEVARDVIAQHESRMAELGARVRCATLPTVHGDAASLRLVFRHLLDNALIFHAGRPPVVDIAVADDGAEWTFTVRDDGIGIAPEDHERVFAMFQRLHTRREFPGLGVGLALCRRAIDLHGGRIWVESAAGAGAAFRFTLPKPRPAA